jgi:tetratricopeptide (TPR) repeat protein
MHQASSSRARVVALFLAGLLLYIPTPLLVAQHPGRASAQETRSQEAEEQRAVSLLRAAFDLHDKGDTESLRSAMAKLGEATRLFRSSKNKTYLGLALMRLGDCAFKLDDITVALSSYREYLQLYKADENRFGVATMLIHLGEIYDVLGETSKALLNYEQAVLLLSSESDRHVKATTLFKIGKLHEKLQDKPEADKNYVQALAILTDFVEHLTQGNLYFELGEMQEALGDDDKALASYGKALEFFRGYGYYRREEAATIVKLASLRSSQGAPGRA